MFPYDAPVPGNTCGQGYRDKALIHTLEPPRRRRRRFGLRDARCRHVKAADSNGGGPSTHHAELVAPRVEHAGAVRAASIGARGPECRQALDFVIDG